MTSTRPLENICFGTFALPQKLDGNMWAFIAIDVHSKFVFLLDICQDVNKESILLNIEMLLKDEEFTKQKNGNFNLIFTSNYFEFKSEIDDRLRLDGGASYFDNEVVLKELNPVIKELYASFEKQ